MESIRFIQKELELSGKKFRPDFPDNSNPPVLPQQHDVVIIGVSFMTGDYGKLNNSEYFTMQGNHNEHAEMVILNSNGLILSFSRICFRVKIYEIL